VPGSPDAALGSTTMGLHHKLAYVLGGKYQLPRASVRSALLPQVAAFNAPAGAGASGRAARALGMRGPEAVGPALFDLADQLKAPTSVADLGLEAGHRGGRWGSSPHPNHQVRGPLPSKISITY
jgi:maleylacetate reductase